MKMFKVIIVMILMLSFSCASTSDVVYDYNLDIDFNRFNTYVLCVDDLFVEHTNMPTIDNKKIRNYLAETVAYEMETRDHRTNILNPQLQVGFIITLSETTTTFKDCESTNRLSYWETCQIGEKTYLKENLVVYVANYKTKEIIWQASTTFKPGIPKNMLQFHIEHVVAQMFETYPKKVRH